MKTEKNQSLKHAPNKFVKWADSVNISCEAPETGHTDWVEKQDGRRNQVPAVAISMEQPTVLKAI